MAALQTVVPAKLMLQLCPLTGPCTFVPEGVVGGAHKSCSYKLFQ